ncbi:MAG: serine/threonine-protein phosphatase [Rhodobacteraceae bacterium]|nr:serine/threonine-protein phosphatase [Paracoccaceae bacterium]
MTPTPRSSARAHYDVASAISIGRRDCQEDAIVADFPQGAEHGFVVLADGMGGHAAGDIASKIVVTEVFSELKLQSGDPVRFERNINAILRAAVRTANDCVLNHATSYPRTNGMGATLLAPVLLGDWLHWISVGDSPLYLYRDGVLRQVNEDHSLAPQIDHMVRSGLMQPERGRTHPDRNCLTSVLIGMEIPRIDCPAQPIALKPGDIVLAASDGLQFLSDGQIAELLGRHRDATSAEITAALMRRIEAAGDPDQDNVTFAVIRVRPDAAMPALPVPSAMEAERMPEILKQSSRNNEVTVMASRSGSGVAMVCRVSVPAERLT